MGVHGNSLGLGPESHLGWSTLSILGYRSHFPGQAVSLPGEVGTDLTHCPVVVEQEAQAAFSLGAGQQSSLLQCQRLQAWWLAMRIYFLSLN